MRLELDLETCHAGCLLFRLLLMGISLARESVPAYDAPRRSRRSPPRLRLPLSRPLLLRLGKRVELTGCLPARPVDVYLLSKASATNCFEPRFSAHRTCWDDPAVTGTAWACPARRDSDRALDAETSFTVFIC